MRREIGSTTQYDSSAAQDLRMREVEQELLNNMRKLKEQVAKSLSKKADLAEIDLLNVAIDSKLDKEKVNQSIQEIKQTFSQKLTKARKENSNIDAIGSELQE